MKMIKLLFTLLIVGSLCLPITARAQTNPKAKDDTKKAASAIKNGKYPDGSLLRAKGTKAVYLIQKGKKMPFPDSATFLGKGYKWENMVDVDPAVLDKIPMGKSIPSIYEKKK